MSYPDLATCGSYTLVAGIVRTDAAREGEQCILLKRGGAIVMADDGAPLAFGSIASAVAWCRA